jgi:hypothetical protein
MADLMTLLERGESRIRVSWTGIAGDSGAGSFHYYLYHQHTDRSSLKTDEDYQSYYRSRTILRAPSRLTIGSGAYNQTTALAFDGTALLPPFFPQSRGEDIIFGAFLHAMSPSSLKAFHPFAITHAPIEKRGVAETPAEKEAMSKRVSRTTFYGVVLALMERFTPPPGQVSDIARLEAIGKYFSMLGAMPAADFIHLLRSIQITGISRGITWSEHHLKSQTDAPPAYSTDLRNSIRHQIDSLTDENLMPVDFGAVSRDEVLLRTQSQLGKYGELCAAWPAIVAASRELNAAGRGLARPIESMAAHAS